MSRPAFRPISLVVALIIALSGLGASTSTAAAAPAPATGQQAVRDAMNAQLTQKPGGTAQGNSIVYASEGVTVTYIPKTAQGTRVVPDAGGTCAPANLCLYQDTYWGTQVLQTTSLWCPKEGTSHLYLSHYGLWGKVQSANSNLGWWARMFWEDSWGFFGAQWTLAPYDAIAQASSAHNDWVEVCVYKDDFSPASTR